MAKKKPTKREALANVPQDREELTKSIAQIGTLQRRIDRAKSEADEKISTIQERVAQETAPLSDELDALLDGVHTYAEGHRDELTQDGKVKTVKLTTGTLFWRTTPPKVNIQKTDEALNALKQLKLDRFIRIKEEVDKEAILKEPQAAENIKWITIVQREEFGVKPSEIEAEVVKKLPSKK